MGLIAILATGCRADVGVAIDVNANGSGRVRVEVVVDKDVTDKIDLPTVLKVDDLVEAGWKVAGPDRRPGGDTTIVATKPFADPEDAARVMGEISGPDGPFQAFQITRSGDFFTSRTSFHGTADLTKGVVGFTDPALVQALGGAGALQQLLNGPIEDAVHVEVSVRLPGRSASWTPSFDQREPLAVDAHRLDLVHVAGLGAVIVALAGAVVYFATHRRSRGRHAI